MKWILWTILGLIIIFIAPYLISIFLLFMLPGVIFLGAVWLAYRMFGIFF